MTPTKHKKFALECRQLRLYISKHTKPTQAEIEKELGFKIDRHLDKMEIMGIIEANERDEWSVIPQ